MTKHLKGDPRTTKQIRRAKKERERREAAAVADRTHLPMYAVMEQTPQWAAASLAAAPALTGGKSLTAAADAVARVGEVLDIAIAGALSAPPKPACHRGCSYCCHVKVDVSIPEVARVVAYALAHLAPVDAEALRHRARKGAAGAGGKEATDYPTQPCAFLGGGECSVYEARPFACRAEHSFDVQPCKDAYEAGAGVDVPGQRAIEVNAHDALMRCSLDAQLETAGFRLGMYELQQALSIALDTPDALERWASGQDTFASARIGKGMLPTVLAGPPGEGQ